MRLVIEYLAYSVNIQTYPFSAQAYKLWHEHQIISPSEFNHQLRQTADRFLNASKVNASFLDRAAVFGFVFDSVKMYYQNLDWPYHKMLGHERNQSIYLCLLRYSGEKLVIGGPGCHDQMIRVTDRSHPHHFNCHTMEIEKEFSKQVQELYLIIWLGPEENYDVRYRQAFLHDLFEQAYGLRVAIHEPGQMANLEGQGIQIEPGRMNELNFEAVQHIHKQTPRHPCIENPQDKYKDLDGEFSYQFELCLNSHLQRLLVEKCSCLYAYLPRIAVPNATLPYCGRLIGPDGNSMDEKSIFARKDCAFHLLQNSAILKKSFEDAGLCLRRCESVDYVSTVSVTTWRSTQWQLHWSQETAAALDTFNPKTGQFERAESLHNYFQAENLSEPLISKGESDGPTGKYGFSDRYTYVLIKRKSNDTTVKAENLVLTLNALVSRIGGLCSLYIGMTFAVFIELIEFAYMEIWGGCFAKTNNKIEEIDQVDRDEAKGRPLLGLTGKRDAAGQETDQDEGAITSFGHQKQNYSLKSEDLMRNSASAERNEQNKNGSPGENTWAKGFENKKLADTAHVS
ncbi:unnamed protein product [Calicophoron daubneyi]|uniref:Uncharacterized protein n=1 Tax=Calicophoron daubneyi TaxID=300641 RepID=A0AAV2TXG3_CALDB